MMKNPARSYGFLWLSVALFPLLVIAVLLPVQPHDYWWYLRLGKEIIETASFPTVDTYSSIQFGQPLVYISWLSAVLFWLIYRAGEIPWTVFWATGLVGISYALLWKCIRENGAGPRLAALITLLAGLSGSNNWGVRPQLFVYPLFLAALWLLLKWNKHEQKFIWLLMPLCWLWTNLHGSFILFFSLTGIATLFGTGDRKKLALVSLGAFTLSLLNPSGPALWLSVLKTFFSPVSNHFVTEWAPPVNQGWQMNIFFLWLLLLVPLAVFSRRPSLFEIVLFLVFSWLALRATRFVIWELFILGIFSAGMMPSAIVDGIDRPVQIGKPLVNFGLGAAILSLPFMLLPGIRENLTDQAYLAVDPQTPVVAAQWLAGHPELPSRMWNDIVFGSYLIHALPERPVWMDTRFQIIFTPQQMEDYLIVQSAQPGWDSYLDEHSINLLFLAKAQTALVSAVERSPGWCEAYRDELAIIFSRCEAK